MTKQISFFFCLILNLTDVYAIQYQYDHLSRLTKVIYDTNHSINYDYDAAGNLMSVTSTDLTNNGGNGGNNGGSLDSDNDGIPDSWEVAFGLNSSDSADALVDLDHDGLNNLAEYQAGRNPRTNEAAVVMPIILQPFIKQPLSKKKQGDFIRDLLPAISQPR